MTYNDSVHDNQSSVFFLTLFFRSLSHSLSLILSLPYAVDYASVSVPVM